MRIFTFLLCLSATTFLVAKPSEPFVAPSFVKELTDLSEVRKKAVKEKKGVTFLLMEPGST